MKRDMDLIRAILFEMEKWPAGGGKLTVPGHTADEISDHVRLMWEAGLIHATDVSSMAGIAWLPREITWEGHEFLDAARSDTVWNKAKHLVKNTTDTLTMEGLKLALGVIIRQSITGGP